MIETIKLDSEYYVILKNNSYKLHNKEDKLLYEWDTKERQSCIKIIEHSNDKKYLIFTTELYGYNVLELDTLKVIKYVPKTLNEYDETFIWCDFHYNKDNDLLAVEGCFWASAYSIIIVDFSNPLNIQEYTKWIDVRDLLEDKYCHIDFTKWNKDNLYCKSSIYNEDTNEEYDKEIIIPIYKIRKHI